jgi:hypothetical protein
MGTVEEWRTVLVSGAVWATLMLLVEMFVFTELARFKKPAPLLTVLLYAILGFLFGFTTTFQLRIFRWPMVAVLVLGFILFVAVGALYRKKVRIPS